MSTNTQRPLATSRSVSRRLAAQGAPDRPLPPMAAPIASLPEWVSGLLPVKQAIPPHAITAIQYAAAVGISPNYANARLLDLVRKGVLCRARAYKAQYYWPSGPNTAA